MYEPSSFNIKLAIHAGRRGPVGLFVKFLTNKFGRKEGSNLAANSFLLKDDHDA